MEEVSNAPFRNKNFMTPCILAYYRTTWHGRTVYVELSVGDFLKDVVYGVTVRGANGEELWREEHGGIDPSQAFFASNKKPTTAYKAAMNYIKNLSRS